MQINNLRGTLQAKHEGYQARGTAIPRVIGEGYRTLPTRHP